MRAGAVDQKVRHAGLQFQCVGERHDGRFRCAGLKPGIARLGQVFGALLYRSAIHGVGELFKARRPFILTAQRDQGEGGALARAGAVALIGPGEPILIGFFSVHLDFGDTRLQPFCLARVDCGAGCRLRQGEGSNGQGKDGHGSKAPETVVRGLRPDRSGQRK